jgi:Mn-dependent DtxR family transcriptional regulator
MPKCAVSDGKVKIESGSPEFLALKITNGLLNYDEEMKKLDVEKQEQVEEARKRLEQAGYIQGYKLTEKGKTALDFLTECSLY